MPLSRFQEKKGKLVLKSEAAAVTPMKVRLGILGDEEASKIIHRPISTRLGKGGGII